METEQIMTRSLHGIEFTQNHKTTFINLTEIVENFNKISFINQRVPIGDNSTELEICNVNQRVPIGQDNAELEFRNSPKELKRFFETQQTQNFLYALAKDDKCQVSDLIKAKRGRYGGTWAHPLVFVKLCCWLSPEFEVAALKIVYDNLLEYRDDSGEAYKNLCTAMMQKGLIPTKSKKEIKRHYTLLGQSLALAILGKAEKADWNEATEEQLKERVKVETFLTQAVEAGLLPSIKSVVEYILKEK